MKKTKLEKGITLIALIITIVVLLILAVVTIGSIRESSIITHSQNAKDSWSKSQTQEELELKIAELKIDMQQNSSNYEFKMVLEDDEKFEGEDEGILKKIFDSIGLTITSPKLSSDGKFKFDEKSLERNTEIVPENDDTGYYLCSYNIPCVDKNNEEKIVNIKFTMREYTTEEEYGFLCKIIQINFLGELGKAINALNEKIINNQSNYKVSGGGGTASRSLLQLIYDSIINEGIKIESTELLNSEKNGFDYDLLFDEENPKVETISVSLSKAVATFDCNCSKEGETLTIRPLFGAEYDSDTKKTDSYIYEFKIK